MAKRFLQCPEKCNIPYSTISGSFAILKAFNNGLTEVYDEIMKHPELCKFNKINNMKHFPLEKVVKFSSCDVISTVMSHTDPKFLHHNNDISHRILYNAFGNTKYPEVLQMILDLPDILHDNYVFRSHDNPTLMIRSVRCGRFDIAIDMINNPSKFKITDISKYVNVKDSNGYNVLYWGCSNNHGNEEFVLKLMNDFEDCGINVIHRNLVTSLMRACSIGLKNVAMKMLEDPVKCNIGMCSTDGFTAFDRAIRVDGMDEVALKLLDNSDKFKIDLGHTSPLLTACKKGKSEIAMKLLQYPDKCRLDYVSCGNTALTYACAKNMTNVALEILKYPDKCNLQYRYDDTGYYNVTSAMCYGMQNDNAICRNDYT